MKKLARIMALAITLAATLDSLQAQAPAAGAGAPPAPTVAPGGAAPGGAPAAGARRGGGRGGGGPVLSVSSTAWPDGGEVPMKHAGRGENKSPAFDFNWSQAGSATNAPTNLVTYAVVLHDIENANMRGTMDTLHWTIFNIPGTAKGISEGLAAGDLPDGSRQGPGVRGGSYFGPGAGIGPFHHYVFEFYALDTKLDLAADATRQQIMAAMEGHVVGKAAYVGRFHATPQP